MKNISYTKFIRVLFAVRTFIIKSNDRVHIIVTLFKQLKQQNVTNTGKIK